MIISIAQLRVKRGGGGRRRSRFSRRMAAIDSLRRVAHDDEQFMALVRQADTRAGPA